MVSSESVSEIKSIGAKPPYFICCECGKAFTDQAKHDEHKAMHDVISLQTANTGASSVFSYSAPSTTTTTNVQKAEARIMAQEDGINN